jgi:hypothetical protein
MSEVVPLIYVQQIITPGAVYAARLHTVCSIELGTMRQQFTNLNTMHALLTSTERTTCCYSLKLHLAAH